MAREVLIQWIPHHNRDLDWALYAQRRGLPPWPGDPTAGGAEPDLRPRGSTDATTSKGLSALGCSRTVRGHGLRRDKAPAAQDGHVDYSDPLDEQTFLVKTIDHLESLPTWKSTAVVITYDDSDGW
jgi:hypothetical protein